MSSRVQVYIIALALTVVGVGVTLYKVLALGFPLLPGASKTVWTLESRIHFTPTGGPVDVSLALPQTAGYWVVLDEYFTSSGFVLALGDEPDGRVRARWSREQVKQSPTLTYKLQVYRGRGLDSADAPGPVVPPALKEGPQQAALQLIAAVRQRAADPVSFTRTLLSVLNQPNPGPDVDYLLVGRSRSVLDAALDVLALADIPARVVRGLFLEDGRRRQQLSSMLEIYDGDRWVQFDPATGEKGLPRNFFVWQRGGVSLLDVIGGRDSRIEFAIMKNSMSTRSVAMMENREESAALIDFSIYALPIEQQGTFKKLLLIPIGALLVVFMRVIVGVRTSGTFMPILIALAFMQTTLLTGLVIFILVVSVGLWIRFYLSYLNLLLVARVSAVIVVVLAIMVVLSVTSYKLGIDQAMTVTFFPMIILSWTIERMSILWEEDGLREVIIQGGGSLAVAVLTYLVMMTRMAQHLTFNFPELLLVVLGLILVLGQYTGYRLTELYRFRHMQGL